MIENSDESSNVDFSPRLKTKKEKSNRGLQSAVEDEERENETVDFSTRLKKKKENETVDFSTRLKKKKKENKPWTSVRG